MPAASLRYISSAPLACRAVLVAQVYVSSCNEALIRSLKAIAPSDESCKLVTTFTDTAYNRSSFTLASTCTDQLASAAVRLARTALQSVDMRAHHASHPRLGAVDHISVHPLPLAGGASHEGRVEEDDDVEEAQALSAAAHCARLIGGELGGGGPRGGAPNHAEEEEEAHAEARSRQDLSLWELSKGALAPSSKTHDVTDVPTSGCQQDTAGEGHVEERQQPVECASGRGTGASEPPPVVPVYLYGSAHPEGRVLAELRRQLGYFKGSTASQWVGRPVGTHDASCPGVRVPSAAAAVDERDELLPVRPDVFLPPHLFSDGLARLLERSGVCCVGAVPYLVNYNVPLGTDDLHAARRIAVAVSEKGGGLPHVQAMALRHGDGCVEVACNLLRYRRVPPATVQKRIEELAAAAGLTARPGYRIGKGPEDIARLFS